MQNKLIALHDLDCPWRPSDLIQRSGRIIRQGNENEEVGIYRYVTEGTFDSYLYQIIENKQKFVSQIMTSKTPVRVAEDIDEIALSYAEIKALACGNPLIIEKTELDMEVAKLKLLKQSYLSQIYDLQDRIIKYYPIEIKRLEERITALQKDIATTQPVTDKFAGMIINGVNIADKEQAGKMIIETCQKKINSDPVIIGEYRNFKMELYFERFCKEYRINLKNNLTYAVSIGTDAFGNITRLDNVIGAIHNELASTIDLLKNTKNQFSNAKQEVEKPFIQEEKLQSKSQRLKEVDTLLNLNEKDTVVLDDGEQGKEFIVAEKEKVAVR